jgi:uncharacterized membrane protein (DUF485 family)
MECFPFLPSVQGIPNLRALMSNDPSTPWAAIEAKPEFQDLLARKKRFIVSSTVFFVVYYFALLVLVGFLPDLMKKPVFGKINWAYLFALSQFFMAWALAFIYTRKAAVWDADAAKILSK